MTKWTSVYINKGYKPNCLQVPPKHSLEVSYMTHELYTSSRTFKSLFLRLIWETCHEKGKKRLLQIKCQARAMTSCQVLEQGVIVCAQWPEEVQDFYFWMCVSTRIKRQTLGNHLRLTGENNNWGIRWAHSFHMSKCFGIHVPPCEHAPTITLKS